MGRHAASRDSGTPRRTGRLRALLSLGLLLGFGAVGTSAYWTDTSEVTSGTFTAGSMDLQFDNDGAVGLGTGYAKTTITWNGLAPGEHKAFNLDVKNVGNPPLTYTAKGTRGTTPAWSFVGTPLTVQLFTGSAEDDSTYPQQDTCTGASLGDAQAIDGTNRSLTTVAQSVAANATQSICVIVGLASDAGNDNQAKTGSVSLTFTASQTP